MKQQGMSLIESLIALAILSFGLIATTKMQMNLTVGTQSSRQRIEAVALAKSKIEVMRSTGLCNTAEGGDYTPLQGSTKYTLTVTCPTTTTPKLVVSWFDSRGGQAKTVSGKTTLVANTLELNTTL